MSISLKDEKNRVKDLISYLRLISFSLNDDIPKSLIGRLNREGYFSIAKDIEAESSILQEGFPEKPGKNEQIVSDDWTNKITKGLETAIGAWKERDEINPESIEMPSEIAWSASSVYAEVNRLYGFLVSFHPFGSPAGYEDLGWDAACEVSGRQWTRFSTHRFGINARLHVGHDLRRVTTFLSASGFTRLQQWRDLVLEPISAYEKASVVIMSKKMISEEVREGFVDWELTSAIGQIDLILIALNQLLPFKHEAPNRPSMPQSVRDMSELHESYPEVLKPGSVARRILGEMHSKPRETFSVLQLSGTKTSGARSGVSRALPMLMELDLVEHVGTGLKKRWRLGKRCFAEGV